MDAELEALGLPTSFGMRKRSHFQSRRQGSRPLKPLDQAMKDSKDFDEDERREIDPKETNPVIQESKISVPIPYSHPVRKQLGPDPLKKYNAKFPTTQEFAIKAHSKRVTALALTMSGNRLLSGSDDCMCRYWNFNSIDIVNTLPTVDIEVKNVFQVNSIDSTNDGKLVMLTSGSAEIQFYNETGLRKGMTNRGDMYVLDKVNTTGHAGEVLKAQYNPVDQSTFASVSVDGTLRFWDTQVLNKQKNLVKLSYRGGSSNPGKDMAYSPDGSGVYVTACDPHIRFYSPRDNNLFSIPQLKILSTGNMSAVSPANDSIHIAARLEDDGDVLFWDIRQTNRPLWRFLADSNLSSICFSPDSQHILVPETVHPQSRQGGSVQIVSCNTGDVEERIWLPSGVGARCALWSKEMNQIIVGCEDGSVRLLFDSELSTRGAISVLERGINIRQETDDAYIGQLTPQLLDPETERIIRGFWFPFTDYNLRDKRWAAEPKAPLWGEGHHGQVAIHPHQQELKELHQVDEGPDERDVVEALRSRSKAADFKYFTHISYQKDDDD